MNSQFGTLYIVSTPIGNPEDISLRALKTLEEADLVLGEEQKRLRQQLKSFGLQKKHSTLNEHSNQDDIDIYLNMLLEGKSIAMICDGGTPLLADPGFELAEIARAYHINIKVVPGASALLSALVLSGFPMKSFYFRGFLNRDPKTRLKELKEMKHFPATQIIYETPYRYKKVLLDMKKIFGEKRIVFLGLALTSHKEKVYKLSLGELCKKTDSLAKAEPVIIF